jgi:hypothetical protein
MNFGSTPSDPGKIASSLRKLQEDPLFLIKKEEAKHHKNLVDNPLVRERVRQMLKAEREREIKREASADRYISERRTEPSRGTRCEREDERRPGSSRHLTAERPRNRYHRGRRESSCSRSRSSGESNDRASGNHTSHRDRPRERSRDRHYRDRRNDDRRYNERNSRY